MRAGLQTHIEGWVPIERLHQVRALRFELARIAAMACDAESMLTFVEDAQAAGLLPIVTIAEPSRIRRLVPYGAHAECRNEDDGDLSPKEYRRILDEMAAIALETGVPLWGGVGSNTDEDTLAWGREVRGDGWPVGMYGLSWHSYGPYPHEGFKPKPGEHPCQAEMRWLVALADGRPILLSEFGEANTTGTSEAQQASTITTLWQAWQRLDLWGACLFQIHDGPNPTEREHRYGIFRCAPDGTIGDLKPVALTVPQNETETEYMVIATAVLSRRDLVPIDNGEFKCRYPSGSPDTILSVQPDGSIQTRPFDQVGAWERIRDDGTRAVFPYVDGTVYAIPLVD